MIYEEAIKQMLEGNQLLIRRAIDGAHYDSTKVGVVISDGTNEGYKIRVGSLEYDNVDSLNNAIYTPNQIVMVTMPQNSLGDMYITGAIGSSSVGGGGGSGTDDYTALTNKPSINGVTLSGNISGATLGLLASSDVSDWAKSNTKPTYTAEEVGALPDTTEIPTKTSDLVNDSGFITSVPTATSSQLGVVKVDGETITINNGVISSVSSGTDDYTALTNKPSINGVTLQGSKSLSDLGISMPTNVSDLTNDSGYVTDTQVSNWLNGIDIKYDATTAKPMWRQRGADTFLPFKGSSNITIEIVDSTSISTVYTFATEPYAIYTHAKASDRFTKYENGIITNISGDSDLITKVSDTQFTFGAPLLGRTYSVVIFAD